MPFCVFGVTKNAHASHALGGEITYNWYECLGG